MLGGDAGLGVIIGVMSFSYVKIGFSQVGLIFFIFTLFDLNYLCMFEYITYLDVKS